MFRKIKYNQIRYYISENDDFVHTNASIHVNIDGEYQYINNNIFYKVYSFLLYYIIAIPFLIIYGFIFRGIKINGRENVKQLKHEGYIIYANHTNVIDAFLGHVFIARPKRTFIIANKDAVSIPFIRLLTKALGAMPVPDTQKGLINLNKAVSQHLKNKKAIIIYPEAHIWDYYTGLRNFPVTSFRFAASNNVAAVPVAVTYRKPTGLFKEYKKPRMVVNIGEPIYNLPELNTKQNANYLCEQVYDYIEKMVNSEDNFALYNYLKSEEEV